jgi:hypothetical protein
VVQGDGNLVVYGDVLDWATGTDVIAWVKGDLDLL